MYQLIEDILMIKNKDFTCFFDPESLIVFAKTDEQSSDEDIIADYKENKKSFPRIMPRKNSSSYQDFSHVSLDLHVIDDCNLRCKYCYVEESCKKDKIPQEMSEEIIEKAYRFALRSFPNAKNVSITLYGGEPLLFWKKFHFLVEKAKEIFKDKKVMIGFPTNGTIVSDEILAFLKKNNISFQLSLDGSKKEQDLLRPMANGKGTSEIINKNLPKFKEIRDHLGVRSTITPYNMNLPELFRFFKEKGFKKITFCACSSCQNDFLIREQDLPGLFHQWDLLADLYLEHLFEENSPIQIQPIFSMLTALHFGEKKYNFCGSGKNLLAVSTDGGIYACHRFIGNEKYKIGDLDQGFYEDSSLRKDLFARSVETEKDCEKCFAKYLCAGGCFHERSQLFSQTFCQIYTHLLAQAIRIYVELEIHHPAAFERMVKKLEEQKQQASEAVFI